MEKNVWVEWVDAYETNLGTTRFVLRDEYGSEYTTFKEDIARQALAAEGKRARLEFHVQKRNGITHVYLDRVELLKAGEPENHPLFVRLEPFPEQAAEDSRRDGEE